MKTGRFSYDVNTRVAYGMRATGRGQTGAETFCAVMNSPKPSHRFQCYNKVTSKAVEEVAEAFMKIAL